MHDLFLSYAGPDKGFASLLRDRLHDLGLLVWWEDEQVESREYFWERINEGLSESSGFIAFVTSNFTESKWATAELQAALRLDRALSERIPGKPIAVFLSVAERGFLLPAKCADMIDPGARQSLENSMCSLSGDHGVCAECLSVHLLAR